MTPFCRRASSALTSASTPVSVCPTAARLLPVTVMSRTDPVIAVVSGASATVYELRKPCAARCWLVCGAMSARLSTSAVRVSEALKLRNGLLPFSLAADRDASSTTEDSD